jgi:hypothetical protein
MRSIGLVFVLTVATYGQACTNAACFGSTTADPLFISGTWTVADGATLDFGPRHAVFTANSYVVFEGGAIITAAKITQVAGGVMIYDAFGAANALIGAGVVQITTTAALTHDGGATFNGQVQFGGDSFWPGWHGLSFDLDADGPAVVGSVDCSAGDPYAAGGISIQGSSIVVGSATTVATSSYAIAGSIGLSSSGNVVVGSLLSWGGAYSWAAPTVSVSAGGDYVQNGAVEANYPYGAPLAGGGEVAIVALGNVVINGPIRAGEGDNGFGRAAVSAGTDLTVNAPIRSDAPLFAAGVVELESGRDLAIYATISAKVAYDSWINTGGVVMIEAGRDLLLSAPVDVDSEQSTTAFGTPSITASAGRDATLTSACLLTARDSAGGTIGTGGAIHVSGCRVFMNSGAQIHTAGVHPSFPPTAGLQAGETIDMDGVMTTSANGSTTVTTRLPTANGFVGSGVVTPTPVFVVDPTLPPCGAAFTTVLTTSPPIPPGGVASVSVQSVPNAPLFVACDTALSNVGLGAYGWTQVNGFGGGLILVDALGLLGPPIPGSTDGSGAWSLSATTPALPSLVGVSIWFDVYVFDVGAMNGLFHQPATKRVRFI